MRSNSGVRAGRGKSARGMARKRWSRGDDDGSSWELRALLLLLLLPPPSLSEGRTVLPATRAIATTGNTSLAPHSPMLPDTAPLPDPILPDPILPDPILPDPILPDPILPDPILPDPILPDPIFPMY